MQALQQFPDPPGIGRLQPAESLRKCRGHAYAGCNRFAVQPFAVAGAVLYRVAESMPQIQHGAISIVCDYCATAFKVKAQLVEREAPLVSEYAGHPSIAKWVDEGYQLIIL